MKVLIDIPDRLKPYLETIEKAEGEDFQDIIQKLFIETVAGYHPIITYAYEKGLEVKFSKTSNRFILGKKLH